MPLFGAHVSIAGEITNAFTEYKDIGGSSLQLFTKNQRRWDAPPLTSEETARFRELWEECGSPPMASHGSYLLNFASGDPEILRKTLENSSDDLTRCEELGIHYLVVHPGSHGSDGIATGIRRIAQNVARAIEMAKSERVTVLLETTSGAGNSVGGEFSHLRDIISASPIPERLGVCVDTCHIFAAGYELREPESYRKTMEELESVIGLGRVKMFHVNDSLGALGSHRDRHEHVGKGEIGLAGFKNLVNDPRFSSHPMIVETPPGKDNIWDKRNLKVLRKLAGEKSRRTGTAKR
ncbi:deoxyribonuclease IV [bacterium]|nr:MAG: deoxyribonuclease IV [bacterium]